MPHYIIFPELKVQNFNICLPSLKCLLDFYLILRSLKKKMYKGKKITHIKEILDHLYEKFHIEILHLNFSYHEVAKDV